MAVRGGDPSHDAAGVGQPPAGRLAVYFKHSLSALAQVPRAVMRHWSEGQGRSCTEPPSQGSVQN